jgi:alginate O-acetyltransferase complex protein AlgI
VIGYDCPRFRDHGTGRNPLPEGVGSPMVFSSPLFLFVFLPAVLALYFAAPSGARNLVLVVASLIFYTWAEPTFALVMLGSIVLNYALGLLLAHARDGRRRLTIAVAVAVNIGILAVFKYLGFLTENLNWLFAELGHPPIAVVHLLLPLGISFFTFHGLSYVIDVYRGTVAPQRRPTLMALYISFFPQLIAGPIIRYHEIAEQLPRRTVTRTGFAAGIRRFIVGLGKKVLIANMVAGPADRIFALAPNQLTPSLSWLGVTCYTLQIYFDFSGYSDMAIGLGRMFGFTFPENFAHPYVARSVTEFWRRWHMSLSRWFRDYLYIPLGGNRHGRLRTYVNLAVVFFLCGLWHGAQWTFVLWGSYHGAFLILERAGLGRRLERLWTPIRHVYLLLVVMVGWVLFRATDVSHVSALLASMAGRSGATGGVAEAIYSLEPLQALAFVAGLIGSAAWGDGLRRWRPTLTASESGSLNFARVAACLLVFAASVLALAAGTYNPFIYFRF